MIRQILKEEDLRENLSKLLKVDIEEDWAGRLWCVINPYIQDMTDVDGAKNTSSTIYQYNNDGTMSNSYSIERWIMLKLNVAKEFIVNNNLFEILSYKIKKLDSDGNFLFVMQNVWFDDLMKTMKRFFGVVGVIVVCLIVTLMII